MEKEKDFITLYDENNQPQEMELVLAFNDQLKNINYILYKKPDQNEECFAAKYEDTPEGVLNLDTELTQEELIMLNALLKQGEKL